MSESSPVPRNVYFWQNGMVMAFDDAGEQIPELQGRRADVLPAILQVAKDTTFWVGVWRGAIRPMTLAEIQDLHKEAGLV